MAEERAARPRPQNTRPTGAKVELGVGLGGLTQISSPTSWACQVLSSEYCRGWVCEEPQQKGEGKRASASHGAGWDGVARQPPRGDCHQGGFLKELSKEAGPLRAETGSRIPMAATQVSSLLLLLLLPSSLLLSPSSLHKVELELGDQEDKEEGTRVKGLGLSRQGPG